MHGGSQLMANTTERKRPDYTGVIIGLILLPVLVLFFYMGKPDMGLSVFIVMGATMFAIRIRWDLRKHIWFWAVIVTILALHVPLFFIVRWPSGRVPPLALLPIAVADCLIVVGAVRFVEKFIVKAPDPKEPMFAIKKTKRTER
jgi:uncharacterized membrane protein YfcA